MSKSTERRFLNDYGQLSQWPSKRYDQLLVLAYLAGKFDVASIHTEAQVNDCLKRWHTFSDWPLLRRELVDSGFLDRNPDGTEYRLKALATDVPDLVLVRPNVDRDASTAVSWLEGPSGRETLRLMGNTPEHNRPSTLEEEQQRLRDFITDSNQITWMLRFEERTVGAVWISLQSTEYLRGPSVHIMIGDRDVRGKGLGRAAVLAVIQRLIASGTSEVLYSRHLLDNAGSARLLTGLGFEHDGDHYRDADGLAFQNVKLVLKKP